MKIKFPIIFIALFITEFCYSQSDVEHIPLTFEEVVKVDSTKKDELYLRAKEWLFKTYVSSKDVIFNEDKSAGVISGEGSFRFNTCEMCIGSCYSGWILYKISIYVKDGRYKYELTNFRHKADFNKYGDYSFGVITTSDMFNNGNSSKLEDKWYLEAKKQCRGEVIHISTKLKEAMAKSSTINSGW